MSSPLTIVALAERYLRHPSTVIVDPDTQAVTLTFEPPLSGDEQATYDDLVVMARFGIASDLTLAEYRAIKADLATGRAFLGLSSPTQAQAVAAEKAIIRVLGALLRDS